MRLPYLALSGRLFSLPWKNLKAVYFKGLGLDER